ncbi:type IV pilus twitching motility protein PilT [Sulfurifustis variabilis]|uniref:type IV pilus twitching motility protein PilT n=1 Tax=Sulfurifustis variabilis TaxID=1675686 RepID=UPI000BBAD322|nr:PilT/PilU family type 4a pilus ATPase [Sulfurifustis variabilis]
MSDPSAGSAASPAAGATQITAATDPLKLLGQVLALAVRLKSSDIHLRTRNHPILRIDGTLRAIREIAPLPGEFMERLARTMMSARLLAQFEKEHQVDLSIGFKDIGRVRANVFYQRGSIGMVLRVINTNIPTPADLKLPEIVMNFTKLERGLVLITGSTGSGKSTTLASLINEINLTRSDHIVTIEDPIEFLFSEKKSIVTQREVGVDTNTFADAMRAVLREDPDVILLGEMRDPETIETAMTAAETGHLVFSTVHSPAAAETVSRIISSFPPETQAGMRAKLAQNLRGVVSQRLLPKKSNQGRVVACEVLTVSALARELILDPLKIKDIADLIRKGTVAEGMMSFDAAIYQLWKQGDIDEETALQHATSPTDLKLKLEGFA